MTPRPADRGSSARRSPFGRFSLDRSSPQACGGLDELRNGVADGFGLFREAGRANVDIVDAPLDDLLQGGAAVLEAILDELRPQRVDVEQRRSRISRSRSRRLLPDTESRTVNTPPVRMRSVSRSSSRSPASTRPTMTRGSGCRSTASGAMTFAAAENPGIRSTPFFSIASCDHTSGTLWTIADRRRRGLLAALRDVCELRGAARRLRELDLQLLLQPFPLDE